MTGMREDLERRLHHQQPRAWHVDATRPGFTHPDAPQWERYPDLYAPPTRAVARAARRPIPPGSGERSPS